MVLKDRKVYEDFREMSDQPAFKGQQALLATLDQLDLREIKEMLDQLVQQVLLDRLVLEV